MRQRGGVGGGPDAEVGVEHAANDAIARAGLLAISRRKRRQLVRVLNQRGQGGQGIGDGQIVDGPRRLGHDELVRVVEKFRDDRRLDAPQRQQRRHADGGGRIDHRIFQHPRHSIRVRRRRGRRVRLGVAATQDARNGHDAGMTQIDILICVGTHHVQDRFEAIAHADFRESLGGEETHTRAFIGQTLGEHPGVADLRTAERAGGLGADLGVVVFEQLVQL